MRASIKRRLLQALAFNPWTYLNDMGKRGVALELRFTDDFGIWNVGLSCSTQLPEPEFLNLIDPLKRRGFVVSHSVRAEQREPIQLGHLGFMVQPPRTIVHAVTLRIGREYPPPRSRPSHVIEYRYDAPRIF